MNFAKIVYRWKEVLFASFSIKIKAEHKLKQMNVIIIKKKIELKNLF